MCSSDLIFTFCWLCIMSGPAHAADLSVACAANFTTAMKELSAMYEEESGASVICAFGSTGMLYGQIRNGAPYDLFFAADEKRPKILHGEGLALAPVLYAKGRVAVWSGKEALSAMPGWKEVVSSDAVNRVGIANPKTAPYGQNAEEAMVSAGVLDIVQPKLAYGKSVGTAFQYAYSGAADVSFVALSQALSEKGSAGTYWLVPEADSVKQAVCILKNGKIKNASLFLEWLNTPVARGVIKRYGYE